MSTLTTKGNWNIFKGKVKQKIARLMGDDREFMQGKQDELTGRIQKRTDRVEENAPVTLSECCDCKHQPE